MSRTRLPQPDAPRLLLRLSDETILDLFDDVCAILDGLLGQVSCLVTSDTGNDPASYIEDLIDELRTKITALTTAALPQAENLPPQHDGGLPPEKDLP